MWHVRAPKIGTDAFGQLLSRQQTSRFHHSPLAMDPLGLNRVEPGTLLGQQAGQNADPCAGLFDLLVMLPDPRPNHLADIPGGIVPNQEEVPLALGGQALTAPLQKLDGDSRDGPICTMPP